MALTLKVEAIGGKSGQDSKGDRKPGSMLRTSRSPANHPVSGSPLISKFPPPGTATLYQK